MTQLSPTTNSNATRDDAHIIVVPPEDHIIVVPPEDHRIVVPPPGPDDYAVVLPGGGRLWVSLPPSVRALLPHGAPDGLLTAAQAAAFHHRKVAAERAFGVGKPRPPDGLQTAAQAAGTNAVRTEVTPKRRRKPSIATMVKRAEKAGKTVTSVSVEGDRVVLTFGEIEPTDANNPWLIDIDEKAPKQ